MNNMLNALLNSVRTFSALWSTAGKANTTNAVKSLSSMASSLSLALKLTGSKTGTKKTVPTAILFFSPKTKTVVSGSTKFYLPPMRTVITIAHVWMKNSCSNCRPTMFLLLLPALHSGIMNLIMLKI